MGQMIRVGAMIILGLALMYLVFRGISSWGQGYTWEEMDWSQKGHTTVADFFAASDIGKREVLRSGHQCAEYFSYKDGMAIKTVCPE